MLVRRVLRSLAVVVAALTLRPAASDLPTLKPPESAPAVLAAATSTPAAKELSAIVSRVIDGDTLDVTLDGRNERVRLIGIDAPEKASSKHAAEPFEKEATTFARQQARGKRVVLKEDPGHEDRDAYGRLLRYVYLPDGRCLNAEMLRQGFARAYTRYRFTRSKEFRALEKEARARGLGIWSSP